MTNVASLLDDVAAAAPEAVALVRVTEQGAEGVTFGDLERHVATFAGGLRARGVRPGDSVVVLVPISLELYVTLLAVFRLGAVAVFIDPWGGRDTIENAAALMQPRAFVGIPKAHALRAGSRTLRSVPLAVVVDQGHGRGAGVAKVMGRARSFRRLIAEGARSPVEQSVAVDDDQTALVTFTTGSTGTPKGADRTHGLLLAQHRALREHVRQSTGDIHFTNLPIVVLHNLGCAVPTLLPPPALAQDPLIAGAALRSILEGGAATVLSCSPEPLAALVRAGGVPLDRVRFVATGGGPVLPDLAEGVLALCPGAEVQVLYGSTEAEPIAHADAETVFGSLEAMREHGGIFVGASVAQTRVVLAPPRVGPWQPGETPVADLDVGVGEPGEVVVAGDHVNRSYVGNPDAVAANKLTDRDGTVWHRTGDIARRSDDGTLWLLGRLGHSLRADDGTELWALELETPIAADPRVRRAALAQAEPREWVLAVEPTDMEMAGDVSDIARELLDARGCSEVRVRILERIPVDRRHATKIDVPALVAALATERARGAST